MSDLKLGENVLDGKVVIVTAQDNGNFKAGFPGWPKPITTSDDPEPYMTVEVSTIPLLTAAVMALLPFHP